MLKFLFAVAALIGLSALAGAGWFWARGIDTRDDPSAIESAAASAARRLMIPSADRRRSNPEPATTDNLRSGLEHWADHCAICHGNDGSGDTPIGRALYPRAPDMRLTSTQELSDGELFYIIENGVKLTGMPAWGTGTAEGERSSWHLVQFIRRLPALSAAEIAAMEELNPRSAAEWRAIDEERRFLAGEPPVPPAGGHVHQDDKK